MRDPGNDLLGRLGILLVVLYQRVANAVVHVLDVASSPSLWAVYVGANRLPAALAHVC
jgi:hypothetical protein